MVQNRTLLRFACFGAAILLAMLALTVRSSMEKQRYRRQLELNYTRSLQELSGQLSAITADLTKGSYAGTPAQLSMVSAQIWKNAGTAKAALGSLPTGDRDLTEVYRFLSQAGDYAMYLARKSVQGEEITPREREQFEQLKTYAKALEDRVSQMEYQVSAGLLDLEQLLREDTAFLAGENPALAVSLDLDGMELQPESYPTLIYDGPFSDHLLERSPVMTKGEPMVSPGEARNIAAFYAGAPEEAMEAGSQEDSRMPSYSFTDGETEVGVTRQGGHVTYLVNGREIGPLALTLEQARTIARDYLEEHGIDSMGETYYQLSGGILTVNFAFVQGDVLCYTDLIKVGVAMDDGQVVFYDARGFINNHRERTLRVPTLSREEAMAALSESLRPLSARLALVPTGGADEALCYEFRCAGKEGEDVLVYVNVDSGAEEQILILIQSENGTLTI